MGQFSNPVASHPRTNEVEVPPRDQTDLSPTDSQVINRVCYIFFNVSPIQRTREKRQREIHTHHSRRWCSHQGIPCLWNNPNLWSDIIIHLRDFHAINAYFGAIGTFVSGSGFEDILFQAGLCSAGNLNGVLSGKHYNRCWLLHESFSEALIRLFQEQYVPEIPDSLINFAKHPPGTVDIEELLADPSIQAYLKYYVQQVKKCLNGEFGKNTTVLGHAYDYG